MNYQPNRHGHHGNQRRGYQNQNYPPNMRRGPRNRPNHGYDDFYINKPQIGSVLAPIDDGTITFWVKDKQPVGYFVRIIQEDNKFSVATDPDEKTGLICFLDMIPTKYDHIRIVSTGSKAVKGTPQLPDGFFDEHFDNWEPSEKADDVDDNFAIDDIAETIDIVSMANSAATSDADNEYVFARLMSELSRQYCIWRSRNGMPEPTSVSEDE